MKWARKCLLMDFLTTLVWPQNETDEDKSAYVNEIVSEANALFGTNLVLTKDLICLINHAVTQFHSGLIDLVDRFASEFMLEPLGTMSKDQRLAYMVNHRIALLDSSEENRWQYFYTTLEKIHLLHFYASAYTPLRDEKFLTELNTTTPHMFSHVAVGAECGIDKVVEEAFGRNVRFLGKRYTPRQLSYFNAVKHALQLPIHKETLPAQFIDLHNRGLQVLKAKSGLLPLERHIYVPDTMEQLFRPCQALAGATSSDGSMLYPQSSSVSAVPQMPVQEGLLYPQYMTGDLSTGSSMVVHSQANTGPVCHDTECYEPENQDCIWQLEEAAFVILSLYTALYYLAKSYPPVPLTSVAHSKNMAVWWPRLSSKSDSDREENISEAGRDGHPAYVVRFLVYFTRLTVFTGVDWRHRPAVDDNISVLGEESDDEYITDAESSNRAAVDPLSTIQASFLVQRGHLQALWIHATYKFLFHLQTALQFARLQGDISTNSTGQSITAHDGNVLVDLCLAELILNLDSSKEGIPSLLEIIYPHTSPKSMDSARLIIGSVNSTADLVSIIIADKLPASTTRLDISSCALRLHSSQLIPLEGVRLQSQSPSLANYHTTAIPQTVCTLTIRDINDTVFIHLIAFAQTVFRLQGVSSKWKPVSDQALPNSGPSHLMFTVALRPINIRATTE
ncbi:hypothetical protein DFJ58DRAFT_728009 [Suillus subalutaceus]|uniref:uncharacterized protein n=1 Tax=Suillus subalutaceus TaxID=48586 RepID=UPI001B869494|nr:uncharacterized protein DFJ58DRAFT_728009 [Suillus subalutaceus]KAG1853882.1 hypothetical protein DFJ58DRAFT_728009 [Suillus subalutaceus]